MKRITADLLPLASMTPKDVANFIEWARTTKLNLFDPDVIGYPRTVMCRAGSDKPMIYIPLQSVLMFDSIAHAPDLSPRQEAMCLWKIGEVVDQVARDGDFREVYFFCRDDRVADICARHGFVEIPNVRVLKKKV